MQTLRYTDIAYGGAVSGGQLYLDVGAHVRLDHVTFTQPALGCDMTLREGSSTDAVESPTRPARKAVSDGTRPQGPQRFSNTVPYPELHTPFWHAFGYRHRAAIWRSPLARITL